MMSLLLPPEVAAMNDLISAAMHCARVLRHAVENGAAGDAAATLEELAAARETLAEALADAVRDLDHTPPDEGLPHEWEVLESTWADIRAGMSGDAARVARDQCLTAERRLIDTARAATGEALPDSVAGPVSKFAGASAEDVIPDWSA